MLKELLIVIGLTFLPFLELRASIPYGILLTDINWGLVAVVAIITNMILGPIIYVLLDKFIHLFQRMQWFDRLFTKIVERPQRKIHRAVEKWGEMGVALFIGVPLPGSGSYSGALGSYLIGLGFRKFVIANIIGNLIAGTIVTIAALTIKAGSSLGGFDFILKIIGG